MVEIATTKLYTDHATDATIVRPVSFGCGAIVMTEQNQSRSDERSDRTPVARRTLRTRGAGDSDGRDFETKQFQVVTRWAPEAARSPQTTLLLYK